MTAPITNSRALRARRISVVGVLSFTQLAGWGTTFDMVGVMGRPMARDLGLANEVIYLGLTVMMLTGAFCGPPVGRWLDRHGAARLLTAGSAIMGLGLCLLALAQEPFIYFAAWLTIGFGGALGLSNPAFTALVEREGSCAKRLIGIVMIFSGLSSVVFWPLLAVLEARFGWRITCLLSAALHLCVCLPLHLKALPAPHAAIAADSAMDTQPLPLTPGWRRLAFLLIALVSSLFSLITFGLTPSLLEILRQSGASPVLALQLGSLRGIAGIGARLVDVLFGNRTTPVLTAAIGAGMLLVSFLALLFAGQSSSPMLVFFVLFYGFGSGVTTLARAVLPLSFFSAREFGLQSGRLALPQNIANAAAPVIFTAILDRAGQTAALGACTVMAILAFGGVLLLAVLAKSARPARERA